MRRSRALFSVDLSKPDPMVAAQTGKSWAEVAESVERLGPGAILDQLRGEGLARDGPVTRDELRQWVQETRKRLTDDMDPVDQVREWADLSSHSNMGPIIENPREFRGVTFGLPKATAGQLRGSLVPQTLELFKHRYWRLYPRRVRSWLFDALMPRGAGTGASSGA